MSRTRSLITAAVALMLAVTLGAWRPASQPANGGRCGADESTAVEQVTLKDGSVEIDGTVGRACSRIIDLYRFEQWEAIDVEAAEPVASARADRHGRFTGEVDRFVDGRDGGYARYIAVARGGSVVLDGPRYVENIEVTPEFTSERLQPDTRKGLAVTMTSDAEAVGAGHAAISVAINGLLLPEEPEEGGLPYESNGQTYWFERSYVEWLDHMIKPMSDRGVAVYLVLVLIHGDEDSSFPLLAHPDAPSGVPTSFMTYGFDTVTEEGVSAFTAVMEFIAERYSRDDERYGLALDYVIGNEINSAGVWHQVGDKPLEEFVATYTPALRIGWQAAQKYSESARVFTSLDHYWTDAADPNRPQQFYPGRDVLDELASLTASEGDFPWNVAQHPYPSDMLDPRVWDDPVTQDPETPKVTFKNLPVLSDHLQRPELQFEGEQRRIILSELGCQSPSNSAEDLELQAACMAYAYYASVGVPGVDAFLWDPQVDNRQAGGLRMGLWTWDAAREDFPAAPGERKPSYDLFSAIDGPDSLETTEFALDVIGADTWSELLPWFDPEQLDDREPTATVPLVRDADLAESTVVEGFEGEAPGWTWADHVVDATPSERGDATEGEQVLQVSFDDADVIQANGRNSKVWRGAVWQPNEALDLTATPVIGLDVRVPEAAQADLADDERLSVRLLLHGADGTSVEGTAPIDADGWTAVDLDTAAWSGRDAVTSVTAWVTGSSGTDWLGTAELDRVRLSEALTEVAPTLSVTAHAGTDYPDGDIEIVVTNHGRDPLPGDLVEVVCDGIVTEVGDLDVAGLNGAGGSRTFTTAMVEFDPADRRLARLCYELDGAEFSVIIDAPDLPSLLYDFEDGTQGWEAGENVIGVDQVDGFPNGPFVPRSGEGALQGTMGDALASEPRSVLVEPAEPIVLGDGAEELYAWVDAYGGVPDATSYEATLTVRSGEHELVTVEEDFVPDAWNRIAVDVSDWPHRDNITQIEVTYRVPGSEHMWLYGPLMQVDDVGVTGDVDIAAVAVGREAGP